jgi:hypothetical protein
MDITVEDIIDLLPIVADRGWKVREDLWGVIRDRDGRCPICALVHELSGGEIDYKGAAGKAMRLYVESDITPLGGEVMAVMAGADHKDHPLRPAIAEALGLKG